MHQLTDLPDDSSRIRELGARNNRMRSEGTRREVYGRGTHYETSLPDPPRIHVDDAARRTMTLLDAPPAPPGIVELVE